MELFGEWINPDWLRWIFNRCREYPQHTFIFLTKKPENLKQWSPFPDNVWIGASATDDNKFWNALCSLRPIKAKVKFISVEPLLQWETSQSSVVYGALRVLDKFDINWLIIGQQTPVRKLTEPKLSWIREIVQAADKAHVPIFLKDNLKSVYGDNLRQEFP